MTRRPNGPLPHAIAVFCEEFFPPGAFQGDLANNVPKLLPEGRFSRVRALVYNFLGIKVGRRTLIAGRIRFGVGSYPRNLSIGEQCYLNSEIRIDSAALVTIGDGVSIAHNVAIITSNHEIGSVQFRAGALSLRSVTIGDGAWIAAGATILPGVNIGPGAIVAAGAVVNKDVPPNVLVAGVPAKVIRAL